jgi:co-chaperonin GroES (HSP10)
LRVRSAANESHGSTDAVAVGKADHVESAQGISRLAMSDGKTVLVAQYAAKRRNARREIVVREFAQSRPNRKWRSDVVCRL